MKSPLAVFFFSLLPLGIYASEDNASLSSVLRAQEIIEQMVISSRTIKALSYRLVNSERINQKMLTGEQQIHVAYDPFRCYVKLIKPKSGPEIFFQEGTNKNQASYNPNGIPYIKLNLDPLGDLMRNNNHHTLYEVGFTYLSDVMEYYNKKYKQNFTYEGDVLWEGRKCYKIVMKMPNFEIRDYVVKDGDTYRSLAKKFFVNEYMLSELNEGKNLRLGQKIRIPNGYAEKVVLYIDQEHHLPLVQKIYDSKGLFEYYEHHQLQVNAAVAFDKLVFNP